MTLSRRIVRLLIGMASVVSCVAMPCVAQVCTVPSEPHQTVQAAVEDPSCDEVQLAAQTFSESVAISRGVTIHGASGATTVIEGQVKVDGVVVVLQGMTIGTSSQGPATATSEGLLVSGGAQVSGVDLKVLSGVVLFGDGFELGSTSRWPSTVS